MKNFTPLERNILIIGDTVTFSLITLIGFASHGTAGTAGTRMFTTWLPLVAAWLLIAPYLGVYIYQNTVEWKQLWRPFWSMILAAPMAAWMRGMALNSPILPLFVIILGGVSAVGILVWRALFWLILRRLHQKDG
ncbi:MAG: DUF3054 domain-containing protein [Anaerolineales bacterium]|jgi:hypothetical protein